MRKACRNSLLLLLVCAWIAGADSVKPDAGLVVGANLSQVAASPLLQRFPQLRDLSKVLAASPGDPKEKRVLLLALGIFDPGKIGSGPDPKLLARITELSGMYDLWAVSTVPLSDLPAPSSGGQFSGILQGDLVRSILEISGGLKFGADVVISVEVVTRTAKDATALADVVRFLVGMAKVGVQNLDLKTQGEVMWLSLSIPEAELEKAAQRAAALRR
jgi:hypothetical protein